MALEDKIQEIARTLGIEQAELKGEIEKILKKTNWYNTQSSLHIKDNHLNYLVELGGIIKEDRNLIAFEDFLEVIGRFKEKYMGFRVALALAKYGTKIRSKLTGDEWTEFLGYLDREFYDTVYEIGISLRAELVEKAPEILDKYSFRDVMKIAKTVYHNLKTECLIFDKWRDYLAEANSEEIKELEKIANEIGEQIREEGINSHLSYDLDKLIPALTDYLKENGYERITRIGWIHDISRSLERDLKEHPTYFSHEKNIVFRIGSTDSKNPQFSLLKVINPKKKHIKNMIVKYFNWNKDWLIIPFIWIAMGAGIGRYALGGGVGPSYGETIGWFSISLPGMLLHYGAKYSARLYRGCKMEPISSPYEPILNLVSITSHD